MVLIFCCFLTILSNAITEERSIAMQKKIARSIYGPRLLIAIGVVLVLGILLIVHSTMTNSVTGIKQVFLRW